MKHDVMRPRQSALYMAVAWDAEQEHSWQHDPKNNNEWLKLRRKNLPRTLKLDIFPGPTYDQK